MPKQHPAQTAAGLVRQWEDRIAPHDLPKWTESAALTMRALLAQPAPPSEEGARNRAAAILRREAAGLLECCTPGGNGDWAGEHEARDAHDEMLAVAAALTAPGAAAAAPRANFLAAGDLADLERLDDLFDDGEGWDLPKERMKRLAELGVIRHHGGGHYSTTSFGQWMLGAFHAELPLQTPAEFNDRSRREMQARAAQTQGGAA